MSLKVIDYHSPFVGYRYLDTVLPTHLTLDGIDCRMLTFRSSPSIVSVTIRDDHQIRESILDYRSDSESYLCHPTTPFFIVLEAKEMGIKAVAGILVLVALIVIVASALVITNEPSEKTLEIKNEFEVGDYYTQDVQYKDQSDTRELKIIGYDDIE